MNGDHICFVSESVFCCFVKLWAPSSYFWDPIIFTSLALDQQVKYALYFDPWVFNFIKYIYEIHAFWQVKEISWLTLVEPHIVYPFDFPFLHVVHVTVKPHFAGLSLEKTTFLQRCCLHDNYQYCSMTKVKMRDMHMNFNNGLIWDEFPHFTRFDISYRCNALQNDWNHMQWQTWQEGPGQVQVSFCNIMMCTLKNLLQHYDVHTEKHFIHGSYVSISCWCKATEIHTQLVLTCILT